MNAEFEKMLAMHEQWLNNRQVGRQLTVSDRDFVDVDFSGRDLSEADFIKCNFVNCNFTETNLSKVKFTRTFLQECVLYRTNMEGTWIRNCGLHSNDMREVNMRNTVLTYSDIIDNDMTDSDLSHSEWFQTTRRDNSMFRVITNDISNYNLFSCTGLNNDRHAGIVCDLHTNQVWHRESVYDFKHFISLLNNNNLSLGKSELAILKGITQALSMYSNYKKEAYEPKLGSTG